MCAADRSPAPIHIEAVWFRASPEVPRELALEIITRASRRVAVPCHLHPEPWIFPPARLAGREQLDADALLAGLEAVPIPGAVQIGLTTLDVGLSLFTFVFGRARLHGSSALVSLARISPERYGLPADPDLTARRAVVEFLHEFGHVAGLAHCEDFGCIMRFAANVESIDLRGAVFCPACASALPRHLVPESPV